MVDLVAPARGNWLVPLVPDEPGALVRGVAGLGFPAYVRILHPAPAQRDGPMTRDEWGIHPTVEESSWRWADVAARTGGTMHRLVHWGAMTGHDFSDHVSVADGWTVTSPEQGYFDPDLLAVLTEHLRPATSTPDDLVAGIWPGWSALNGGSAIYSRPDGDDDACDDPTPAKMTDDGPARTTGIPLRSGFVDGFTHRLGFGAHPVRDAPPFYEERRALRQARARRRGTPAPDIRTAADRGPFLEFPIREFILFATDLDTLADPEWPKHADIGWSDGGIGLPLSGPMPQLIWPEDHAWVLASEIDWDSTILAGPRGLVDAVLADDRFETFEVYEDDELAWESDTVNGA